MVVGERLRVLREEKELSQGDIEKRSGLLRCYISRVENGHTVPSVETLEKLATALQIPLYRIFFDGEPSPNANWIIRPKEVHWGESGKDAIYWRRLRKLLGRMKPHHRSLLMHLTKKLESRNRQR